MIHLAPITEADTDQMLEKYLTTPLLAHLNVDKAYNLLSKSFLVSVIGDKQSDFDIALTDYQFYFEDYLKSVPKKDIALPSVLLEGTLHYSFSSPGLETPLSATISAPISSYLVPFAFSMQATYPDISLSADSKGIVFHPAAFREAAYRNPALFETMIKDRERIYGMLLKWLPISTVATNGCKVARFLLAALPDNPERLETVHMTQTEIAKLLEISRATLSKSIAFLLNKGIISTGHGKITVDVKLLHEYLNPPPPIILSTAESDSNR